MNRGGVLRTSLQQSSKKDGIKNSISTLDMSTPDGTNPLNLGTAGSRRTVYLGDDLTNGQNNKTSSSSPDTLTPTNENVNSLESTPSTFLMYNRINTMIGSGNASPEHNSLQTSSQQQTNGNDSISNQSQSNDRKKTTNGKSKESTIWYEYGCV